MLRGTPALAAILLIGGALPAGAQQGTGAQDNAGLFISPIPRVKADPEAVAAAQEQADAQAATDEGRQADQAGADPLQTTTGDVSDETEVDEGRTDGSSVRVVFGGSSVNQNPRASTGEDPAADEDDSSEPRWKRERSRRFKRAPNRSPTQGLGVEIAAPIVPIAAPDTVLLSGARLRQLDKMTGQTETFDLAVGETRRIARLQIRLDACRAPADNDTHGTMAFMQVWDTKHPERPPAFSGWMFAESPALSALDHPRYDLWVINCTTSAADSSASTE